MVIANIFGPDLGYVVIIVLVVMVGGSQLPKIARNIGTAGKEFRKAQREAEEEAAREQAHALLPSPDPLQGTDVGRTDVGRTDVEKTDVWQADAGHPSSAG